MNNKYIDNIVVNLSEIEVIDESDFSFELEMTVKIDLMDRYFKRGRLTCSFTPWVGYLIKKKLISMH